MRKFEFVERIKEVAMETVESAYCELPKRSTKHSAGYDIFSTEDFELPPKATYMLKTGVKAQMETNEVLLLNVRSSMGKKHIMLANTQGWVDSDYYNNEDNEGEIGLLFYNYGEETWKVQKGDKVAQAMFVKFLTTDDDTVEQTRKSGWGSTN